MVVVVRRAVGWVVVMNGPGDERLCVCISCLLAHSICTNAREGGSRVLKADLWIRKWCQNQFDVHIEELSDYGQPLFTCTWRGFLRSG